MRWTFARWRLYVAILLVIPVLVGIYAAVGYGLAPYLIQSRVLPALSETLGGTLTAEAVDVDPFRLVLTVHNLSLKLPDGGNFASIGQAEVDVDGWSSLRNTTLELAGKLSEPDVHIAFDKSGTANFDFLLPKPTDRDEPEDSEAFPFRLTKIALERGRLAFEDNSRGAGYRSTLSTVNFTLENLSSVSGEAAPFTLGAKGDAGEILTTEGTLALVPVAVDGDIKVTGLAFDRLAAYLGFIPEPFAADGGKLSASLHYQYDAASGKFALNQGEATLQALTLAQRGAPYLQTDALEVKGFSWAEQRMTIRSVGLSQLSISTPPGIGESKPAGVGLDSLSVTDIAIDLGKQTVSIDTVDSAGGKLAAWLNQDGELRVAGQPSLPATAPASGSATPDEKSADWVMDIHALTLHDYAIRFTDQSATPAVEQRLESLNLRLSNISTALNKPLQFKLTAGKKDKTPRIDTEGELRFHPLTAELKFHVDQLALQPFQGYLNQVAQINLLQGHLAAGGDLTYIQATQPFIRFSGEAGISNLVTQDQREHRDFINWKGLQASGVIFETVPRRLSIREIVADEPYARVIIHPDTSLNLAQNLRVPEPSRPRPTPKAETAETSPLQVIIAAFRIVNGRTDFADLSLQPTSFAADIHGLNGKIRGLSSQKNAKADILLTGAMQQNSPVKISGQFNPFSPSTFSDIVMQFQDINLTTLSPYSGKFAGYRIEKGKMTTDLRYRLRDNKLKAENRFILDHLTLGERVDSPDATSLPVRLAVALMKDISGQIDLDLPISGDLNNPKVSIRGLLAEAATQLISKFVASPFTLLGSLFRGGSENLDSIHFEPGKAELDSPAKGKLNQIAIALKERPGLSLEIKGVVHPTQDKPHLAEQELLHQLKYSRLIELRIAGDKRPEDIDAVVLSDADYRRLFTHLYRVRKPNALELLGLRADRSLEGAVFTEARRKLLDEWTISELDLRRLAQARGQRVRKYLVEQGGLSDQRIYLLDIKVSGPEEKEIAAQLSLTGA